MSEPAAAPQSNMSVPPAQVTVTRSDLAEARRVADLSPQQRHFETIRTEQGWPQGEQLGVRKLSEGEYSRLTYAEKIEYAERRTELANKPANPSTTGQDPKQPPEPVTPEAKVKIGETEITETELRGLMERKGLEDSKKLTLPQSPDAYQIKLPADFVAPQGVEYKIDPNSPAAELARNFAHEAGLSQAQFERMVAIHAATEVQQIASLKTARDAELTKLGATARQRIAAVETFMHGHLGDDLGKAMMGMLVTAKHVQGFEQLMQKFANAVTSYSPSRSPAEPARISDAEWNSMSYSQQKEYAAGATAAANGGRR